MAKDTVSALRDAGFEAGKPSFTSTTPDALTIVGLDTDDGPDHCLWDDRARFPLDVTLVSDILERGIRDAVHVRRNGNHDNGAPILEVVYGRQRVKSVRWINEHAGQRLGVDAVSSAFGSCRKEDLEALLEKVEGHPGGMRVPFVVDRGQPKDFVLSMISENSGGIPETIRSLAFKIRAAATLGYSEREIATMARKAPNSIAMHLAYLDLHPSAQAYVDVENSKLTIVEALSRVPFDSQPKAVEKMRAVGARTGEAASEAAQGKPAKDKKKRLSPAKIQKWLDELEELPDDEHSQAKDILRFILGHDEDVEELRAWDESLVPSWLRGGDEE